MNIHVEHSAADKPSLVLLHGWGTTSEIWRAWIPKLREHYAITCIDLPGLGRSRFSGDKLDLEEVLNAIAPKIPTGSILLGWSLGGMLAILLSERLKGRLKALVTISCNPCFIQRTDWQYGMPVITFEQFARDLALDAQRTLQGFYKLQALSGADGRAILKMLKHINNGVSHSHLADMLGLLRMDCRPVLAKLTLPSLHIYGEKDLLVAAELTEILPVMSPRILTVQVLNAGHLPFVSDPELISAEITSFMRSIDSRKINVISNK
ncbi:MAG: alpha/beta fold hydrolase [Oceanospirillaceae bacterium]|nr:alpha/beta fold hydrolase [Oceanospirillaceae bacterium]